jgi:hypothetical protein
MSAVVHDRGAARGVGCGIASAVPLLPISFHRTA